ncbi:hypothetical protein ACFLTB_06480 [Chloroflexota bacterium]
MSKSKRIQREQDEANHAKNLLKSISLSVNYQALLMRMMSFASDYSVKIPLLPKLAHRNNIGARVQY